MTRGPKRVVSVLLTAIILSTGYLDYWAYSQAFYKDPTIWMDVVGGTANAPSQYRIGVVDSAYFLARHLHAAMRHTLAILDVISGLIAVFALFLVLQRSAVYRRAGVMAQWFGAASFIVLVQFYLAWLLWYQRPETLPTAAALALTLLLVSGSPGREGGGGIGTAGTVLGLLLLAVAQGFVRADVAFALHLGILFICLTKSWRGLALPQGRTGGYQHGGYGAGCRDSVLADEEGLSAGELRRYSGAAIVLKPEVAPGICAVSTFYAAGGMDRGDAVAEAI